MQQKCEGFTGAAGATLTEADGGTRLGAPPGGSRECGEVADTPVPHPLSVDTSSGGVAAPRLEKRTYSNARYRITLRDFGRNLAEVGWSFVGEAPSNKAARGQSTQRELNEDRAVRRAKSRLRHLILSANATHLLTLTYRENVIDFMRASYDLNRFVRKMKVHQPDWIYVAVAEQQERGAWHWHLAVRGRQDVELLRRVWREVVGEGNIDVSAPKGTRKDRRLYLVRYLGKYLVKAFATGQRDLNQHRFRASRQINVPIVGFTLEPLPGIDIKQVALNHLRESAGSVGFEWSATDMLSGWACSWK